MKFVKVILLLVIATFAQNYKCSNNDPSFRVELRYMETEEPQFISYVDGDLWAHWYMNKHSMVQRNFVFNWYIDSETVISFNQKTNKLRLINIGEYVSINELNCKES